MSNISSALGAGQVDASGVGSDVNVEAIMFAALMARGKLLAGEIANQAKVIEKENRAMREANEWMSKAIAAGSAATTPGIDGKPIKQDYPPGMQDWLKSMGIDAPAEGPLDSKQWDALGAQLKAKIDNMSGQSQEDMTRLQQWSQKYNQNNQMCSDFMAAYYQGLNAITRNISG